MKKTTDDVWRFVTQTAEFQGWRLNLDRDYLSDLVEGLKTNYNRYGYFLCPCRDGTGKREQDRDIICPCAYNLRDQKEFGHCYCGLFLDPEFAESEKSTRQIPERRPEERQPY